MGWALNIDKADISKAQIVETPQVDLADGQARLSVKRFALTANNVTYAVFGAIMRYWDFFPAKTAQAGCRSGALRRSPRARPTGLTSASASMAISPPATN
jgi:hypothetical protein